MHTGVSIRLTEPVVMLVGGLDHERARARRRRAVRAAHAPPGTQSPSSSRPGSRASSPVRSPLSHELGGEAMNDLEGESGQVRTQSRARSHARGGAGNTSTAAAASSRSRSRSRNRVRVREPVTTGSGSVDEQNALDEPPPAMLRGLLTVHLAKPSRIKDITLKFKGIARTDWPEGIGSRRLDVMEETTLINTTHTFFSAANESARRAASIGPGVAEDQSRGRSSSRRSASVMPTGHSNHMSYPPHHLRPVPVHNEPSSSSSSRLILTHDGIDDIPEEPTPAYHTLVPSVPSSPVISPSGSVLPADVPSPIIESRRPPLSQTPSRESTTTDSSGSEHGPGWASAPVPGSTRSSFERGRPALRRSQLDDLEESPDPPAELRPTYQSFPSQRQSLSPAPTERRSSFTTSTPSASVDGRRDASSKRSPSVKPLFSLAGVAEVLRGKSSSRTRTIDTVDVSRRRAESPDALGKRDASRGRKTALKALRQALTQELHLDSDDDHATAEDDHKNWKDFRAGTYTYPIAIPIPASLPPTILSDFGHVAYHLKANVHRAGALTANLHCTNEVVLVSCPGENDTEESESIVVERFWETQMKYTIILSGKTFAIGGSVPVTIRMHPLAKVKLYRISVVLEQKTTYYASNRKVARHEVPKKFTLLRIEQDDPKEPLLPILSDSADALSSHPLRKWFINPTSSDDTTPSCLDPSGPWFLESLIPLPNCKTKVNFSTHHDRANISISHNMKVILRVERGDNEYVDSKGNRKLWDVIVETPVHLLSCKCSSNLLPSYSRTSAPQTAPTDCGVVHAVGNRPSPIAINMGTTTTTQATRSSSHPPPEIATLEQNLQYARLVAGEETPGGEVPPSYDEVMS